MKRFSSAIFLLLVTSLTIAYSASRSQVTSAQRAVLTIPLNQDSFKITVNETGIHELTFAELQAAGMDMGSVNPQTFAMMYRGNPISHQFSGDTDSSFEAGESVRFYGWEFDGSRYEYLYTSDNFYWLWPDGAPATVADVANELGNGITLNWRSSVTIEENNAFSTTYFRWFNQPNEQDAWYWDYLRTATPLVTSLALPHPDPNGSDAAVTAEVTARNSNVGRTISVTLGTSPTFSEYIIGNANRNLTQSLSAAMLETDGTTAATIATSGNRFSNNSALSTDTLLNRITVDYWRLFIADNNELIFNVDNSADKDYAVEGLSSAAFSDLIAWDVTANESPENITLSPADFSGGVLSLGRNKTAGSYIVTTVDNLRSATAIEKYVAPELNPSAGAGWVGISHADFSAEANRLASYRTDERGMSTHVVDVKDVINQYGYGFPTPDGIKNYMQQAYDTWSITPEYLLLFGDATQNPAQRPCNICSGRWKTDIPTYVPTDLLFEDRFQGMIPSDHTFSLVAGDDLKPDIAVGRIAGRTSQDIANAVDKTIRYESAVIGGEDWIKDYLFVADDADGGGNFCLENQEVMNNHVPSDTTSVELCYDDYVSQTNPISNFRSAMFNQIALRPPGILNYRGHGSINIWGAEGFLRITDGEFWDNDNFPTVVLSADCLDSNFVASEINQSLSETFLLQAGSGSAAHWGSTGLGFSDEHSVLHNGFYDVMSESGTQRIGDIINETKSNYIDTGRDRSEIYAFTLHGDPALVMKVDMYKIFLPTTLK